MIPRLSFESGGPRSEDDRRVCACRSEPRMKEREELWVLFLDHVVRDLAEPADVRFLPDSTDCLAGDDEGEAVRERVLALEPGVDPDHANVGHGLGHTILADTAVAGFLNGLVDLDVRARDVPPREVVVTVCEDIPTVLVVDDDLDDGPWDEFVEGPICRLRDERIFRLRDLHEQSCQLSLLLRRE